MEKTVKIDLTYPVQLADKKLESITIRRPNLGNMLDYPMLGENRLSDFKNEAQLITKLCSLKEEDMHAVDYYDYERIQDEFVRFRKGKSEEEGMDEDIPTD